MTHAARQMLHSALTPVLLALLLCMQPTAHAEAPVADLAAQAWIHGAEDCDVARTEADHVVWQRVDYRPDTVIFRQSKCTDFEGPFVYLFVGTERALLIDTGATEEDGPALYEAVRAVTDLPIVAAHSHGHGDHRMGDPAFAGKPDVALVGIGAEAVRAFFGFEDWPLQPTSIDLGERILDLVPIPGHTVDDVAFYDRATTLLITGDSLYPGRLYVRDWPAYKASMARLATWAAERPVAHVLGTHIEMTATPNVDYPMGTTWQPDEAPLPLPPSDLARLAEAAQSMDAPARIYLDRFIIWPVD